MKMHINWQSRELNLKIVYYGPAMSGKTTNLEQIHARTDPKRRSELVSLKTQGDRTLFFDFLQIELGKIGTLVPKIQLYTVPGQSYYAASRRLVLNGADGIVFVADSSRARMMDNLAAWKDMVAQIASMEIPLQRMPIVVQLNKQDLPNVLPPEMLKKILKIEEMKTFPAVAMKGVGVFDTLKCITLSVIAQVQKEMA
jgi:mutual gliding-motility protein MglA